VCCSGGERDFLAIDYSSRGTSGRVVRASAVTPRHRIQSSSILLTLYRLVGNSSRRSTLSIAAGRRTTLMDGCLSDVALDKSTVSEEDTHPAERESQLRCNIGYTEDGGE
jgi:hypothetical protein